MSAFRMFAATLIAAVNLLTLANALNVPANVFSTSDLKGADTRPIKNIYTFGDSYTDNCNAARFWLKDNVNALFPFPSCLPAPIGRADNGLAWPEYVAKYRPDWDVKTYAVSAATCDAKQQNQGSVDIGQQLELFQTRFKTELFPRGLTDNPNTTVATLLIGGNDLALIQQKAWGKLPSYASSTGTNEDVSMCIKKQLDGMHKLGFRRFVLFELPPIDKGEMLGSTADHAASTAALIQRRNALSSQYAADLVKQWNDGSTISVFPTVKLLTPMVMLNSAYEFKNGQGKYCNAVCPSPYDFAWADGLHVSFRAFQLMANAFVRFLDPNWKSGAIFSDVPAGQLGY
ncbi:unnamed protein product [Tilletia controversa]|uniref:SGNH hydrolase-type esterase domain-containing protein n=3 Tax=Tilletia TaxID=13289 RepID=A0A8X7MLY2_9BASI|nr:hypothetical protein CF336_g7499 [Tilletia laevis]KAE8186869.1 hypothetical protein CF328_g7096 [Tilletia controversa]KAE8248188.1 hypothetical protein A4X03_0g6847 [Tilletia caries]KAE8188807.1 hypothetical protein CF335_g6789 [Tilletia laevis]KAE8240353.1 hypothetical protein A4X06_0g7805 [Tilletia controversa]